MIFDWIKSLFPKKKKEMERIPSSDKWKHVELWKDGDDLVLKNAKVTAFGGWEDEIDGKQYGGNTASGVSTLDADLMGCALPRNYTGKSKANKDALGGSPIPATLPFLTTVIVTHDGKTAKTKFVDVGPAAKVKTALDLTVAAAKIFNPKANANNFRIAGAEARIIGGAKYL